MTDAGMSLDRAGGGAASGEGERLPGRLSLFSFFHERKRILTVIQKAVADKQLHEEKATETRRTLRLQQNTSENRRKCEELKQSLSSLYYITLFPSKQQRLYEHICE